MFDLKAKQVFGFGFTTGTVILRAEVHSTVVSRSWKLEFEKTCVLNVTLFFPNMHQDTENNPLEGFSCGQILKVLP